MSSFAGLWPELQWRWCRLDGLSATELHRIHGARQQVFVLEQRCAYLDADDYDESSFHLAAWAPQQRLPLAYARVVDPGVKYPEPSIGRVLTTAAARGTGLGRELVRRAIAHTWRLIRGKAYASRRRRTSRPSTARLALWRWVRVTWKTTFRTSRCGAPPEGSQDPCCVAQGAVERSSALSQATAWACDVPHISRLGRSDEHTAGRSG